MEYTNSPLVDFTQLSPNHSGKRTHKIDRITPHCYVGQVSVDRMGRGWATEGNTSANYGIGSDGRIGLYVEEKNRSWCSSSRDNDQRAITIECASDSSHPYAFKDIVYSRLIDLCIDICKRNGKTKLLWLGDKTKALNYEPAENEMVLTVHRWFTAKECPGDWLYSRLNDLAFKVTALLELDGGIPNKNKKEDAVENNIKYYVQLNATYNEKKDAEEAVKKLKAAGFNVTIKTEETSIKQDASGSNKSFKIGDVVKIQNGAPRYGKDVGFAPWVYSSNLYVREITGSRVVISILREGDITGAVDKKYLAKV